MEKGFENRSSLRDKDFKLMVTFARFYTFLRGRKPVNIKFILLNFTSMFFKGSCFTILGYSITPFGGDSNHVEFNQFICIAS